MRLAEYADEWEKKHSDFSSWGTNSLEIPVTGKAKPITGLHDLENLEGRVTFTCIGLNPEKTTFTRREYRNGVVRWIRNDDVPIQTEELLYNLASTVLNEGEVLIWTDEAYGTMRERELLWFVEGAKERFQDYINFTCSSEVVSIKAKGLNRPIRDVNDLDKLPDKVRFELNHGTLVFEKETIFEKTIRWKYRQRIQLSSSEFLTILAQAALDKLDIVYNYEHVISLY